MKKLTANPDPKSLPEYLYANGVGIGLDLWHNAPKKYHQVDRQDETYYVPVGDKRSSFLDGGYCFYVFPWQVDAISIYLNGDCITFSSANKDKVFNFTKVAKRVLKKMKEEKFDGVDSDKARKYFIENIVPIMQEYGDIAVTEQVSSKAKSNWDRLEKIGFSWKRVPYAKTTFFKAVKKN